MMEEIEGTKLIPIFTEKDEKEAFGNYMNSLEFSTLEHMFSVKKKKKRNKKKCNPITIYSCNICKKIFHSITHVNLHCLIHTNLKPFACPKCPYTTNSKGHLYVHMRKHTGNVFHCSQCNYHTGNQTHLHEHEATHSHSFELCELCMNFYKTTKSLHNHVRRYHKNLIGKKYLKKLTSTKMRIEDMLCNICQKKFYSKFTLEQHYRTHEIEESHIEIVLSETVQISNILHDKALDIVESKQGEILESSILNELNISLAKTEESHSKESLKPYCDNQSCENNSSKANCFPECFQKDINILGSTEQISLSEVLLIPESEQSSELHTSLECMEESNISSLIQNCEKVSEMVDSNLQLHSTCDIEVSAPCLLNSEQQPEITSSDNNVTTQDLDLKIQEERKSAETKLFEKCPRLQAYVCCLCSAIYINSGKLKDHLKEHVSTNNTSMDVHEFDNQLKKNDLDKILLDPVPDVSTFDKLLEELYNSSLDMSWKMPELSVTIEYDPALFDSVLEDASSFPIGEKYDTSEELNGKATETNVLNYFDEF